MATKQRSTKAVVEDARTHLKDLVDAHVALAKAELAETQRRLVKGIVPLVIAGVLALYVLGFFAVTAAKGLDNFLTEGWAWLVVSLGVAVVAVVLGLTGKRKLDRLEASPVATQESVQDTVAWARTKAGGDR